FARVVTNGLLCTRERLRRFQKAGLREMVVSLDGLEATHNRLRLAGPHGWRKSMRAVRDAIDLGLRLRVTSTAFRDNAAELLELMSLVESMRAAAFSVLMGSPLGRGRE